MTVHNYRLVCPNGLFFTHGELCEKCSCGNEHWCILRNCENSYQKSLGYALRNFWARIKKYYINNVHVFSALTKFQKSKLIENGFPSNRIEVLSNMSEFNFDHQPEALFGDYVGYIGRVSHEKGLNLLIDAAWKMRHIEFNAAGGRNNEYLSTLEVPDNFKFLGQIDRNEVNSFLLNSRFSVLCSIWYEGFPMVLIEAMLRGKPVVASRIGGIPEIVDDGVTGLLFEPGDVDDLIEKIDYLWNRPDLCKEMGMAGRLKAKSQYSSDKYYSKLMYIYSKAIEECKKSILNVF
jgi:glycosyltransferase involved in cell wall biosynthesis